MSDPIILRGYCLAGYWTPESAAEHPRAVEQLGIEFCRCGADVTQGSIQKRGTEKVCPQDKPGGGGVSEDQKDKNLFTQSNFLATI